MIKQQHLKLNPHNWAPMWDNCLTIREQRVWRQARRENTSRDLALQTINSRVCPECRQWGTGTGVEDTFVPLPHAPAPRNALLCLATARVSDSTPSTAAVQHACNTQPTAARLRPRLRLDLGCGLVAWAVGSCAVTGAEHALEHLLVL